MKKTIFAILLLPAIASAKDACFIYDAGAPEEVIAYKIKVEAIKPGQSKRLTGVAVYPNDASRFPMTVEGSALGLTNGHINYHFTAIGYDGYPVSEPVYVLFANQPSYSGTESFGLEQVWCDGFPDIVYPR